MKTSPLYSIILSDVEVIICEKFALKESRFLISFAPKQDRQNNVEEIIIL
jgi:hypothetical protein